MSAVSPVEVMIQALAREVREGEFSFTGTLSPIPAAACYLAQLTHAPKARLLIFHSPEWPFGSELEDLFNLAQRGELGLVFLSGAQIDRRGNTNLVALGPYDQPKVRLPGGAGSAMLSLYARRTALFLQGQTARSLVEKVDFVTAPGGAAGEPMAYSGTGASHPLPRPGGTCRLVTDRAVFGFDPEQGLVLESIHPGGSLKEVQAKTGFKLTVSETLTTTPAPDKETLALIHGPVRERLERVYPRFAREL